MKILFFGIIFIILFDSSSVSDGFDRKANAATSRPHIHILLKQQQRSEQYNDVAIPLQLKKIFIKVAITASSFITAAAASKAQIPTSEEYYNTMSGAVITQRTNPIESSAAETLKSLDLRSKLLKFPVVLEKLEAQLKKEQWDEVITTLKALKELKQIHYGTSSLSALADTLQISKEVAEEVESNRIELNYLLGQVNEQCIRDRVYYFNSEDLKQTQQLIEETKQQRNELSHQLNEESLSLLQDAKELAMKLVAMIRRDGA